MIIVILSIAGVISTAFLLKAIQKIKQFRNGGNHISKLSTRRLSIAILTPSTAPPSNLFTKGLVSQLKKYASFEFDVIECDSKYDTVQGSRWAEYIMEQKPDLIFSVSKVSTDIIMHLMLTRKERIPIISAGIPVEFLDRESHDLQKSLPLTGVTTSFGWEQKIALLKRTLPHLKNVLVLFKSIDEISRINLKEKNCIMAALRKQHINAKMHHIANISRSSEMSREILEDIDLVIISRSSSLMAYAEKIATECADYNVPCFSTDKIASDKVFITISSDIEERIGERCAKQAMKILEDGIHPSQIPMTQLAAKQVVTINLSLPFIGCKKKVTEALPTLAASVTLVTK
jgi:ABC-type uncharacterized transport system substrate-binding protein